MGAEVGPGGRPVAAPGAQPPAVTHPQRLLEAFTRPLVESLRAPPPTEDAPPALQALLLVQERIVRYCGLLNYKGSLHALAEILENAWDADSEEVIVTISLRRPDWEG